MLIREVTPEDTEALTRLSGELGYQAESEAVARRLARLQRSGTDAVFVAEAEAGTVIGWIHVFHALRLGSPSFAEIGGLVVTAAHRGRGVGRALVQRAEDWARQQEVTVLRVRTNVTREETHRVYEAMGFDAIKGQTVFRKRLGETR